MDVRVAIVATAWLCAAAAAAQPLTVANFGGANGRAQTKAFMQPFTRLHGVEVAAVEFGGELAPIREMVLKRNVTWDVAEVESADLAAGCKEGLFERIDTSSLPHSSMLLPGSVSECGVGAFVWSTVMAYDASRLKEVPRNWVDFWDVNRFPGKRGLRKGARYNMEFALMADGVKRSEVYRALATEEGIARALRKLETLKPHIVWWESGAQPPKMLAEGKVAMSSAFNGRIAAANREGLGKSEIAWMDTIHELDHWVIVKGSPRRAQAMAFIGFATSEDAQLAFSREITYGPTHFNAILKYDTGRRVAGGDALQAVIDLSMVPSDLPSAPGNLRRSLAFDTNFWIKHGAALEKRFAAMMN